MKLHLRIFNIFSLYLDSFSLKISLALCIHAMLYDYRLPNFSSFRLLRYNHFYDHARQYDRRESVAMSTKEYFHCV